MNPMKISTSLSFRSAYPTNKKAETASYDLSKDTVMQLKQQESSMEQKLTDQYIPVDFKKITKSRCIYICK